MKSNDLIILDKIIDEESKKMNEELTSGVFFEYFCASLLLKNYDLSSDELKGGIIDGKDDGGIDAIYFFVNGVLVNDIDSIQSFKGRLDLDVVLITSKHEDTFKQSVLNSEYSTICEFFDLSKNNEQLTCSFNASILEKRLIFITTYIEKIQYIKGFSIKYYYVSRGDENNVADNISKKADQIVEKTKEFFGNSNCGYCFVGCSTLLSLFQTPKNFNLSLEYVKDLSADEEKYIVLCRLSDYYSFITDDNNSLKRYLFDSNVRDFNGYNKTNTEILNTLEKNDNVDFWWLNNGITILASRAFNVGKFIKMDNVQIVNGLQTSYTIHDFFSNSAVKKDDRKILVKIITENNQIVRDRIIRATNNQTSIQEESLHSTDKYQRAIETLLLNYGFYYERRKNYYFNKGIDSSKLVTPLLLASGYFSFIDRDIVRAITLRQNFMRNETAYNIVFVETNIECWPRIAAIFLLVNDAISNSNYTKNIKSEKKYRILRSIISFIAVSKYFSSFNYKIDQFASLSLSDINNFDFEDIIKTLFEYKPIFDKNEWKKKNVIDDLIIHSSNVYSIDNLQSFLRRKHKVFSTIDNYGFIVRMYKKIKPFIPAQPWPKNVHKTLAKQFRATNTVIYEALSYGISIGDYYKQDKGELFDKDNNKVIINKK